MKTFCILHAETQQACKRHLELLVAESETLLNTPGTTTNTDSGGGGGGRCVFLSSRLDNQDKGDMILLLKCSGAEAALGVSEDVQPLLRKSFKSRQHTVHSVREVGLKCEH